MLSFLCNSSEPSNDGNQNKKHKIDNENVNISHDSLMLNVSISILGLILTIIYYNNFKYSLGYNFSTLFIAGVMILLTATDIIIGCRKYHTNGWKVLAIITSIVATVLAVLLLVVIGGFWSEILEVNTNIDIIFKQGKQLTSLNDTFKKIGFLNINDYIKLYPLTYAIQSLANLFKALLKRHKTHKNKKK